MGRDIVDIVMEKSFVELNDEERAELSEFCATEEEFMQLKHVFASVESMDFAQEEPRPEIKEKLDHLFEKTYPAAIPVWYNSVFAVLIPKDKPLHRQPMLQIAAMLVLIFLTVPLMQQEQTSNENLIAEVSSENVVSEEDAANGSGNQVTSVNGETEKSMAQDVNTVASSSTPGGTLANLDVNEGVTRSISVAAVGNGPGSDHPDGVFTGSAEELVSMSVSAQETSKVLDLLTATF